MNDEIREIEEWLRDISTPTGLSYSGDRTLSNSMVDKIVDYITNLQQEKEDYKSKVEKAVEYIKKHIQKYDIDSSMGDFDEFDMLTKPNYLLNILKNGDNNEVNK